MLVSFIIPSYNSASTVKRCLDSIFALSLNQSEYEIIFVDDCSSDNTCDIVTSYQAMHLNVILLKQITNNRQGAARNRGLNVAKGRYVCFVDSDDMVAEGIVSAISMADCLQTDMTAFHYCYANEHGCITQEKEHLPFLSGQLFSGVEMQNKNSYWCSSPWAYVYSKKFLECICHPFCEGVLYEDSDFVTTHLYYARRMAYSSVLGYVAYYRADSTTHSNNFKNLADYLLLGTRMLSVYSVVLQDIDCGRRTDDGIHDFADSVLEGACFNITKSIKRLFKLSSASEIIRYYNRVDLYVDRNKMFQDNRLHKFPEYWNAWVRLCIKHRNFSVVLNACLCVMYKCYQKLLYIKSH